MEETSKLQLLVWLALPLLALAIVILPIGGALEMSILLAIIGVIALAIALAAHLHHEGS
ncbi:MAG: hypothetical protein IRY97_11120 [Thermomicrobiaceae bacterium]|nr:hypothetical protein [Thermomicrobiaceae bacterium]